MSDTATHAESGLPPDTEVGDPPDDAPRPRSRPKGFSTANVAAPKRMAWSRKGALALAVLISSVTAVCFVGIKGVAGSGRKTPDENEKPLHDRPAAAAVEPRRLDMPPRPSSAAPDAPAMIRVPALAAAPDDMPAIAVRRAGEAPSPGGRVAVPPEDAPVLLVSTRASSGTSAHPAGPPGVTADAAGTGEEPGAPRDALAATSRNLQAYQQQLQGMLENLTRTAGLGSTREAAPPAPAALLSGTAAPAAPPGLFGGQLQASATPRTQAATLRQRSLTLPKGTAFTCALKTRVISATSGLVGCVVQRNVYGDDGRVLLIERGSHLDGEYRITSVRPGMVRIPVLWTRVRTPLGVVVDIESPGTGALGESGIDGHVDNRWSERIGAAMLLSLIDDAVKISLQNQGSDRQGDTLVLPSTTSNTSKLAEKVLDSTINIPPLIYQHQGAVVGIHVARDVDFSSVYQLVPEGRQP